MRKVEARLLRNPELPKWDILIQLPKWDILIQPACAV
ncbi:MAG: hypothetical protein N838_07290 [Thiohalocapsa sp. PB-PSB1]|jgi:hypothetical protein|nr:MAG: hypothetical protein N838_07290 [Thiohalocapsa sp. PB-PSB1]